MAADVLRLLYLQANFPGARVVGRAHGKTRRAAAVNPLVKEAIHIDVRRFFNRFDQV